MNDGVADLGRYGLVLIAFVIASIGFMVVGMVAIERAACYERAETMGATRVEWSWSTGCYFGFRAREADAADVPEDLLGDPSGQRGPHAE